MANPKRVRPVDDYGPLNGTGRRVANLFAVSFIAGIWGAITISLIMLIGRLAGLQDFSLELLLGTLVTGRLDAGSWIVGFIWHIMNGGVFGLFYAAVFRWIGKAGALAGAQVAVIHWLAGGFLVGLTSAMNPFIPALMRPVGFFGAGYGNAAIFVLFAAHIAYGVVVGAIDRASREPAIPISENQGPGDRLAA
ncbi:MAG TPA: hypothetical protein VJB59_12730 [Bdellovibrionota bacterium]|nr:hypothetical protein [Bdellovibrionota bacterium]